jgi:MscS family membrane protein
MKPVIHSNYLGAAVLIAVLFGFSNSAPTADVNPLRPADTSSPRATLQSFIAGTDAAYLRMKELLTSYSRSDRLYLNSAERAAQADIIPSASKAIQSLDVSGVLPVLRQTVSVERAVQLKEILDRIELPSFDDIPDREAMVRSSSKKWRLPNTEIDIVLIEKGPRAGDYLVSAETVDRLPEFYDRVKTLPYKPGAGRELSDAYRALSSDRAATVYEAFSSSPVGLRLPDWARTRIAGVAAWQWLGFAFGLLVAALFIFGMHRLARRLTDGREDQRGRRWPALLTPLAVILVAAFLVPPLCAILRIGGSPLVLTAFIETGAVFLSAAWLSIIGASMLGETIAASEHLNRRSLDSQLIRLGLRFVGIVVAIGFLIQGANELGFPAYSVLAGLGVGGLAVALAARDSLANLLGSILIMFEKPFRVGQVIRVSGSEGTVEDVGFRSTRIRTLDNSLISIPNNTVVNATVENLSLRVMRRQRFFVQITYDTPREKVQELAARIKQLITDHPMTNKTNIQVRFNDFAESSLNILVYFYLNVADYTTELQEREAILLQIMDVAKELGVEFAFPTRTLRVETMSAAAVSSEPNAGTMLAAQ